jgi:putative ABC transport system permease protein
VNGLILDIFEQGLIFGVMVLGVFITYRILDFPDLSVDGSFPLGAAITASSIVHGVNPFLACILSLAGGLAAGAVTGVLHVKLKITGLLSGILVSIGLYSVNLRIMGKANVPLFNKGNIFAGQLPAVVLIALFAVIIKLLLDLFLKTRFGFLLIATGDNPQLVTSLGINNGTIKIIGLMISNGLVALSGALMAQLQRFSDVGMGTGTVVMGLASIIIGQTIFKRVRFIAPTTMALGGAILYKTSTALALKLGLPATDLKLITAVIVIIALGLNQKKFNFKMKKLIPVGGGSTVTHSQSV